MFIKLFILTLYIHCAVLTKLKSSNDYGPYVSAWNTFTNCQGPKPRNATKMTTVLVEDQGSYVVFINITYFQPVKFDEIKIQISVIKGGTKTTLWTYKMKDPCKQIIFETILHDEYNISKDCLVPKGNFYYRSNLTDMWVIFVGNSFFYGEYWMKTIAVSKTANICCVNTKVRILKPT